MRWLMTNRTECVPHFPARFPLNTQPLHEPNLVDFVRKTRLLHVGKNHQALRPSRALSPRRTEELSGPRFKSRTSVSENGFPEGGPLTQLLCAMRWRRNSAPSVASAMTFLLRVARPRRETETRFCWCVRRHHCRTRHFHLSSVKQTDPDLNNTG